MRQKSGLLRLRGWLRDYVSCLDSEVQAAVAKQALMIFELHHDIVHIHVLGFGLCLGHLLFPSRIARSENGTTMQPVNN